MNTERNGHPSALARPSAVPRTLSLGALAVAGALLGGAAQARDFWSPDADTGFTLGAGYEHLQFDDDATRGDSDVSAFAIDGGYSINRWLGLGLSTSLAVIRMPRVRVAADYRLDVMALTACDHSPIF